MDIVFEIIMLLEQKSNLNKKQISFTLYPAHSREGRENLALRHIVPHFPLNSGDIAYCVEIQHCDMAHNESDKI